MSLWSINIQQREKSIKWSKNSLFNKWCWESWTATCKKMKLYHQLTPHIKINSCWIKDVNMSCDIIKVLEKNIGMKISDIPHSNVFTNMSPRARDIKGRINKWDLWKSTYVTTFLPFSYALKKLHLEPSSLGPRYSQP